MEKINKVDYPEFDRQVVVSQSSVSSIPDKAGVYFFHDTRGVFYIGESGNLRTRFIDHLEEQKNPRLASLLKNPWGQLNFSWIKKQSKREAEHFEKLYLKMFPNFHFFKKNKLQKFRKCKSSNQCFAYGLRGGWRRGTRGTRRRRRGAPSSPRAGSS